MVDPDDITISFPCDYPIKVIGNNAPGFRDAVLAVVRRHAPDLDDATVSLQESRKGGFVSVRCVIRATGEAQLRALHGDLKADDRVHMVL